MWLLLVLSNTHTCVHLPSSLSSPSTLCTEMLVISWDDITLCLWNECTCSAFHKQCADHDSWKPGDVVSVSTQLCKHRATECLWMFEFGIFRTKTYYCSPAVLGPSRPSTMHVSNCTDPQYFTNYQLICFFQGWHSLLVFSFPVNF